MNFCTLASSSSGNCTLVSHGDTYILIDAGISMRRTVKALGGLDIKPEQLSGILVTHEHSDHICGLKMLLKYYDIPVYTSRIIGDDLCAVIPEIEKNLCIFNPSESFELGQVGVRSYHTPHDVPESLGYRLEAGGRTLAFATDLGIVTQEVYDGIKGADAAIVEANHDVEMLRTGPYPYHLKARILSEHGHLSNDLSGELCSALAEGGTRKIVLAHLSKKNNTPQIAYHTVSDALYEKGAQEAGDVLLAVAPADQPGKLYTV
ncbi:MAG: MBL fold metallo-hydrolase [Oscillospiraceae bacterium]|nr:MBL fold metallo-hydrolase [Oscillospiraceae bacterium]